MTAASLPLKYDSTAPTTTATAARVPDANGWYNLALAVSFSGTDALSGIAGCSSGNYAGPDASSATVNGSCTDKAGNVGTAGLQLKYDATAPNATATAGRSADVNGWYNHPLTVSFAGTDATSGIAGCSPAADYNGPDNAGATVTGSCTDKAGNVGTAGLPLKYDSTSPNATAAASRGADANGWYNHPLTVTFSGTDATSGIASCSPNANYNGPDTGGTTLNGSCTDRAGNAAAASLPLRYDSAPPTATATAARAPDVNGWYNHPLSLIIAGADALSGIADCSSAGYSGPDGPSALATGACTDNAGNVLFASLPLKYDATAPATTATASRSPDANGWYNHALTVSFSGTDTTAGVAGCSSAAGYAGPDTSGATVTGSCTDKAGNVGTASLPVKYDSTPPKAGAAASRGPDTNGWYNHALTVDFSGTDATSGIAGCSSLNYAGPDTASVTVNGSCTDKAGNVSGASLSFKYDATAPATTATASRGPDANGWYNHSLSVTFSGMDATSGIAACSNKAYSGPNSPGAKVTGSCTDNAGNVGLAALTVKYDATPPTLSKLTSDPGNRTVELKWTASPDTKDVEVARTPGSTGAGKATIYRGSATSYRDKGLRIGKDYVYTVTAFDEARNTDSATIRITATGRLLSPPPGARVAGPPLLVWTPVAKAHYYNVQLVHGKKVMSVWPRHAYCRLPKSWVFQGRHYRLTPGLYRWYVWPGFGQFTGAKYGRSLGGSSFVVVER